MQENKPLLNNPEIYPTADVLQSVLKESYIAFEELSAIVINNHSLHLDWKYYKCADKGWHCKFIQKKKTIFWLTAEDGYFRMTFWFLERHLEGITKLDIDEDSFRVGKEWWVSIPMIFDVFSSKQFPYILKMIEYKKEVK